MVIKGIRHQAFYLHNNGWFKDVDHYFIIWLVQQKQSKRWAAPLIPDDELEKVMKDLNHYVCAGLSWDEACLRRKMLYQRYNAFRLVLAFPGCVFKQEQNVITGLSEDNWKTIFEMDDFAKAYYHSAESEWNNLELLFYVPNENPLVYGQEIKFSTETEKLPSDDEEINSPGPVSARRRLFDEDYVAADEHSSTTRARHLEKGSNSRATTSRSNRGGHNGASARNATDTPGYSSCASCSPFWKC